MFLILVVGLLVLNSAINAVFYDTGLPLLYVDEGYLYQEVSVQRGVLNQERRYEGYPPLMLAVYSLAQVIADVNAANDTQAMSRATHSLRILTALSQTVTLALLMALAKRMAGNQAALLAGIAFVMLPSVHQWMLYAQPEAWAMPLMLVSAISMGRAITHKSKTSAIVATVAALAAIGFKYSFIPLLGFGVAATVWHLLNRRTAWLGVLIVQVLLIGLWALALLFVFDANKLVFSQHPESSQFASSGIRNLLNSALLTPIIEVTFRHSAIHPILWLFAIGLATIAIVRRRQTARTVAWIFIVILTLANLVFIVTYLVFPDLLVRYTSINNGMLVVLLAVALVTITKTLPQKWQTMVLMLLSVAWLGVPVVEQIQRMMQEERGAEGIDLYFRNWLVSRSAGGVALEDETLWFAFHPIWAANDVPRSWVALRDLPTQSLEQWRDEGLRYIAITEDTIPDEVAQWMPVDDLFLLKTYPNPQQMVDLIRHTSTFDSGALNREIQRFSIYQLFKPQFFTDALFGDSIQLVGYDLNATSFSRGETVTFTPYWQAVSVPKYDYQFFAHLSADTEIPLAQADGTPATERFPTTQWLDSQEIIVGNRLQLVIPETLATGDYVLRIGLYRLDTNERLIVGASAESTVNIALRVNAP